MIFGIGTDICQIARIGQSAERTGLRFVEKVLGPEELEQYRLRGERSPERAVRYLATRWAAKEALGKALGTGVVPPMTLASAQVLNDAAGKPAFVFSGALAGHMRQQRLSAQVTVSDEADYAVAFVIVEQSQQETL
ncbi:holo-ACP synthase [Pseudoduganella ginsengisoli]|uniref:Holo-[acyl-carrier-protein] synthase n=1 Tax=Pseudoduganella ginsengisoli TaxID=1462440 RepID=A0A6L6PY95_9BURK|nr:holo-ACP synthase [Pseudoduganella ginsengisoli]MTW02410.1 holo-ACP synthase [Pseudoduganella ginsengisoli]